MKRGLFALPDKRFSEGGYWQFRYLRGNPRTVPFKPVFRWVYALAACLLLTSCASTPKPWVVPVRVPVELTEPVAEPVLPDRPDNGQLAAWADELQAALREANRRLRAIRDL